MAASPKFYCKSCNHGTFMHQGPAKKSRFGRSKGDVWNCTVCKHPHLVDNYGNCLDHGDHVG